MFDNFSGLDPSYYVSLPGYAFDSMMKLTNCKLEIPPLDVSLFLERGIRGGMSFINTRYARGSADRDSKKPGDHIFYIDANK